MSVLATEEMSAVATGHMSTVETRQMSAVETCHSNVSAFFARFLAAGLVPNGWKWP